MRVPSEEELGKLAHEMVKAVRDDCGRDVRDSVRTRCRQIYGLMYRAGLLSTISRVYAGAEGELHVKEALRWLRGQGGPPQDGDKAGYAIYASFMCRLLECMDLPVKEGSLDEVLNHIASDRERSIIVEEVALRFARWLKRMAEALLR